jgi:hypothetical protein
MIDKPSPVHMPAVPYSFLVQMPSPHQSSNKCGELLTSSDKNLADQAEISPSSNNASCCSPRLPSTHTTYGQPGTSTTSASSMITVSAAILKASKTSSNPSRSHHCQIHWWAPGTGHHVHQHPAHEHMQQCHQSLIHHLRGCHSALVHRSPTPQPLCHRYYRHQEQNIPGIWSCLSYTHYTIIHRYIL